MIYIYIYIPKQVSSCWCIPVQIKPFKVDHIRYHYISVVYDLVRSESCLKQQRRTHSVHSVNVKNTRLVVVVGHGSAAQSVY